MRRNLVIIFVAVLLLAPWPVVYAHDNALAGPEQMPVEVRAADASAAPSWSVFNHAVGGVTTPGDLFYISSADSGADMLAALHLTNAEELIHYYRYLILNVVVYSQDSEGQWEKMIDTYLTMRNGMVNFTLPGYAQYKITIDGGSFYINGAAAGEGSASPKFYLSVE